jgi:hypothetical protein
MNIGTRRTTFALAIIFSLMLHFIALSGIRGISFVRAVSPDIFLTSLETELPNHSPAMRSKKTFPGKDLIKTQIETQEGEGILEEEETVAEESDEQDVSSGNDGDAPPQEGNPDIENQTEPQDDAPATDTAENGGKQAQTPLKQEEKNATLLKPWREKLYFELYWLGIYVGNATFEAVHNNGELKITSQAHSAPFVSTFYKVEDYAESRIVDGEPVHFKIKQQEGKYRSNKETIFDQGGKKVTFFNHLKETRHEHAMEGTDLWDVISGFYYLRTHPMETGKTISLTIFDSNKFLTAEVTVVGRERIADVNHKVIDTVIVKPVLNSDGLFKNKGTILVWFTDDAHRIPVKMETEVPVGKVIARLMSRESE